jgi:hypothetical protein
MTGLVIVVKDSAVLFVREEQSWRLPVSKEEAGLDEGCNVQEKNGSLFWNGKISSFDTPFANLWGQGKIDLFTKKSIVENGAIPEELKEKVLSVFGE